MQNSKTTTLAKLKKGETAIIIGINEKLLPHAVELVMGELEQRLLEIGLIEGTQIKVLHYGLISKDPIALQIGSSGLTIAIRRNEAEIILVNKILTNGAEING